MAELYCRARGLVAQLSRAQSLSCGLGEFVAEGEASGKASENDSLKHDRVVLGVKTSSEGNVVPVS